MSSREALLDGARRCLQERGYAHTTARDVAAASGVGLASIGYHFGSKDALLDEALRAAMAEWTEEVVAAALAVGADCPPWDRLRAAMAKLTDSFATQRPIMIAFVEALGRAEREPTLRADLAAAYEQLRAGITGVLGELGGRDLASLIVALTDGMLVQWLLDPEHTPSGAAVIDALGNALDAGLRD